MKKIIILCLIAASLGACGKAQGSQVEIAEKIKEVKVQKLESKVVDNVKDYNGELSPVSESLVVTPTGGDVKKVYVKNGDRVNKGDVLLTLTDAATESKYYEAEGTLIKAKSDYSTSRTSFEEYKDLYGKKLISEDTYLTAKNQMEQGLGNLKVAQAGYLSAKDNFDRLTVTAKISGVVTDLSLKEYEKVAAGQELVTVVDDHAMEMVVAVSGEDLKNTKVGNSAFIYIPELNQKVAGKVSSINFSADDNSKKYDVKLVLENPDNKLVKGMYGQVQMTQGKSEGIFVPKEAVMIKDLYAYIAVVREGKTLICKVDQLGSFGDFQKIGFKDFHSGDKVVVQGQYLLNNNDKVKES